MGSIRCRLTRAFGGWVIGVDRGPRATENARVGHVLKGGAGVVKERRGDGAPVVGQFRTSNPTSKVGNGEGNGKAAQARTRDREARGAYRSGAGPRWHQRQ